MTTENACAMGYTPVRKKSRNNPTYTVHEIVWQMRNAIEHTEHALLRVNPSPTPWHSAKHILTKNKTEKRCLFVSCHPSPGREEKVVHNTMVMTPKLEYSVSERFVFKWLLLCSCPFPFPWANRTSSMLPLNSEHREKTNETKPNKIPPKWRRTGSDWSVHSLCMRGELKFDSTNAHSHYYLSLYKSMFYVFKWFKAEQSSRFHAGFCIWIKRNTQTV